MNILLCSNCGIKGDYSEEEGAYLCSSCKGYLGTMIKCPDCELPIRIATRERPYTLLCSRCSSGLTLGRDNRLRRATEEDISAESLKRNCPNCQRPVAFHWKFCPNCQTMLNYLDQHVIEIACPCCGFAVEPDWYYCVHCAAELREQEGESQYSEDNSYEQEDYWYQGEDGEGYSSSQSEDSQEEEVRYQAKEEIPGETSGNPYDYTSSESEELENSRLERKGPRCSGCGKSVKPGWSICQYCMKPLKDKENSIQCPHCGNLVESEKIICRFCYGLLVPGSKSGKNDEKRETGSPWMQTPVTQEEEDSLLDGSRPSQPSQDTVPEKTVERKVPVPHPTPQEPENIPTEPAFPLIVNCRSCGSRERIQQSGRFRCPTCRVVDTLDKWGHFVDGYLNANEKNGDLKTPGLWDYDPALDGEKAPEIPRCPVCGMITKYYEEMDDYYCFICEHYLGEID